MNKIRIGAPPHVAARPLIYGLAERPRGDVRLVFDHPGPLAETLERGHLDAALIPSIEFLRGVGSRYVHGPALVANGRCDSILLATRAHVRELRRIAVDENSRTPLAALRIVLDKRFGVMPDFCVFKGDPAGWCENYDGVLLAGDAGLQFSARNDDPTVTYHDLGDLWRSVFRKPLVLSLWAYNDDGLDKRLERMLVESRDLATANLSVCAADVARTTGHDPAFLDRFFRQRWSFDLGEHGDAGLKALETSALEYLLIREQRADKVLTG